MALRDIFGRVFKTADAPAPRAAARTADGIQNAAARLGINQDNISSWSSYSYTTISRNRQNIDNAYRGSWLVGVAVDSVADDMTRAGIEMTGKIDPADIEAVQETLSDLAIWQALGNTVRWARLYGGCIAVMLLDGQNLATPLRHETIRQDQFKGLLVLDRWMVTPDLTDLVTEFGPEMGMPRYYQMNTVQGIEVKPSQAGASGAAGTGAVRIHYSRVIRFDGNELPFYARQAEQGWGQSVIERLYDRLLAYDSATQGAAQLVFKAHLRTLKVVGLRDAIAFGGKALDGVTGNVDLIRKFQSSDGMTLLDSTDEFDVHSYTFTGLPELLTQFGEQLSGALQIPIVRLFGQSPAGFGSGDTDLQSYYDTILSQQESKMRRSLVRLLDVIARSKLGRQLPPGFGFKFVPLWQMKAKEKADVAAQVTAAVVAAEGAGIISQKVAMQELRQSGYSTGIFSNVSDEDIDGADAEPPDPKEAMLLAHPGAAGPDASDEDPLKEPAKPSIPGVTKSSSIPAGDAVAFEEAKHKRDGGKFSATQGAGAAAKEPSAQPGAPKAKRQPASAGMAEAVLKDGKRMGADGGALPPHIAARKIPPAWTGVKYAEHPDAALQVQGTDGKGRVQSVYSDEFNATQAAAKFARIDDLAKQFPAIQDQNASLQRSSNPKVKDNADCLDLVMKTGVRPGSEKDTGADKRAFGATTIQGQHVVEEGGKTFLRFVGKKGVSLNLQIDDAELATMLKERSAQAGPDGKLFGSVNDASLLGHTHTMGDGSFKSKDFRTHLGTATAAELVDQMPTPTDEKQRKKAINEVADKVARKLGNTRTIALQSYIAPQVWAPWGNG